MHIFKNPNFDFVRWKWQAIGLSWLIILAGARSNLRMTIVPPENSTPRGNPFFQM